MVHRALMTRVPEALEATLHPHATCAVAKSLLHKMVGAREAGRVMPQCVMPFAGASPPITGVAHRMEALARIAISFRVEVGRDRSPRAPFWGKKRYGWPWILKSSVLKTTYRFRMGLISARHVLHFRAPALQEDPPDTTLDDLREAITTYEDTVPVARRVLGGGHPLGRGD